MRNFLLILVVILLNSACSSTKTFVKGAEQLPSIKLHLLRVDKNGNLVNPDTGAPYTADESEL